jgi:hypothetical protein
MLASVIVSHPQITQLGLYNHAADSRAERAGDPCRASAPSETTTKTEKLTRIEFMIFGLQNNRDAPSFSTMRQCEMVCPAVEWVSAALNAKTLRFERILAKVSGVPEVCSLDSKFI